MKHPDKPSSVHHLPRWQLTGLMIFCLIGLVIGVIIVSHDIAQALSYGWTDWKLVKVVMNSLVSVVLGFGFVSAVSQLKKQRHK